MSSKIQHLGAAIAVLAKAEAYEILAHAEVDLMHAPSECHALVSRGDARRARLARKHAEAIARRPLRVIRQQAKQRGGFVPCSGDPRWQEIVSRFLPEFV